MSIHWTTSSYGIQISPACRTATLVLRACRQIMSPCLPLCWSAWSWKPHYWQTLHFNHQKDSSVPPLTLYSPTKPSMISNLLYCWQLISIGTVDHWFVDPCSGSKLGFSSALTSCWKLLLDAICVFNWVLSSLHNCLVFHDSLSHSSPGFASAIWGFIKNIKSLSMLSCSFCLSLTLWQLPWTTAKIDNKTRTFS